MIQSEKDDFLNRFCHLEKDGEPYVGYQNKEGVQPVGAKYVIDYGN